MIGRSGPPSLRAAWASLRSSSRTCSPAAATSGARTRSPWSRRPEARSRSPILPPGRLRRRRKPKAGKIMRPPRDSGGHALAPIAGLALPPQPCLRERPSGLPLGREPGAPVAVGQIGRDALAARGGEDEEQQAGEQQPQRGASTCGERAPTCARVSLKAGESSGTKRFQRMGGEPRRLPMSSIPANDPIREAVWRAISETGTHQEVAAALKRRYGWRLSDRAAVARLSMMLSPRDPHQLPADALLDVVAITGRDEITPLILRAGMRRGMARVRHARERRREA